MSDMSGLPQKPRRRWIAIVLGIFFLIFVLGVGAVIFSVAILDVSEERRGRGRVLIWAE